MSVLALHHSMQLIHGIRRIVLIVEASDFLVSELPFDIVLALFSAIKKIVKLCSAILLKVRIILGQLHQVHEAVE